MTFSLQDTVPEYLVGILSKEHAIAIAAKKRRTSEQDCMQERLTDESHAIYPTCSIGRVAHRDRFIGSDRFNGKAGNTTLLLPSATEERSVRGESRYYLMEQCDRISQLGLPPI
jgi:hypothetical protein